MDPIFVFALGPHNPLGGPDDETSSAVLQQFQINTRVQDNGQRSRFPPKKGAGGEQETKY